MRASPLGGFPDSNGCALTAVIRFGPTVCAINSNASTTQAAKAKSTSTGKKGSDIKFRVKKDPHTGWNPGGFRSLRGQPREHSFFKGKPGPSQGNGRPPGGCNPPGGRKSEKHKYREERIGHQIPCKKRPSHRMESGWF